MFPSLALFALLGRAFAAENASAIPVPPESKAHATDMGVKESVVLLHGQRFRRIEAKSESFYLRVESPDEENPPGSTEKAAGNDSFGGGRRDCLRTTVPLEEGDARIVSEVKVTKVTSVYLEALHDQCTSFNPRSEVDGQVGVKVKTGEQSDVKVGFGAISVPKATESPYAPPVQGKDLPTTTRVGPEVKFDLKF